MWQKKGKCKGNNESYFLKQIMQSSTDVAAEPKNIFHMIPILHCALRFKLLQINGLK